MGEPPIATVADAGRRLTVTMPSAQEADGWHKFEVTIESPGCHARTFVSDYGSLHLGHFFAELESHSHGWDGERAWASIEGQLSTTATINRLGHVSCKITLRDDFGPTGWTSTLTMLIESGDQLSVFTRNLAGLFGPSAR